MKKQNYTRSLSESGGDLRELAWKLMGIAWLIQYSDPSAVPDAKEMHGIGNLISEIGSEVEEISHRSD